MIGIIVALIFAAIGYGIATIKIPETNNFDITIAEEDGDEYDTGSLVITFYDSKGEGYPVGFKRAEDILACVTSMRIINYKCEIVPDDQLK